MGVKWSSDPHDRRLSTPHGPKCPQPAPPTVSCHVDMGSTKTIRTPGPGKSSGKQSKKKKQKAPPKKPPTLMETRAMSIERNCNMMKSLGFVDAASAWKGLGEMNKAGIGLCKPKMKTAVEKQKKKAGLATRASKRIAPLLYRRIAVCLHWLSRAG